MSTRGRRAALLGGLLVGQLAWAAGAPGAAAPAAPAVAATPPTPPTAATPASAPPVASEFDLGRPDIAAFIDRVVRQDGLPREWLTRTLAAARARPELIEAMEHPAETVLPWWQYRARFVTPQRVLLGSQFWVAHKELIDEIAAAQGVAPEYLVAILGIETRYGLTTGHYREIDTLMTLAFDYPSRGRFFREELRQYLLLVREQGLDPVRTEGSYGGALGALQFMPSSYRRFAVDPAGATQANLWNDWEAILASEANFLRSHGWRPSAPVLLPATLAAGSSLVASGNVVPDVTVGTLRARGLRLGARIADDERVVLIGAPEQNGIDYAVGFHNFYVITRYNPSLNYALAVQTLAEQLRALVLDRP